jgi:hypothetical protein
VQLNYLPGWPETRLFILVIDVEVQQDISLAGHQFFHGYLTLRCHLSEITLDGDADTYIIRNRNLSNLKCSVGFDYEDVQDIQHSTLFFVPIDMILGSDLIPGPIVTPSDMACEGYIRLGTGNIRLVPR